mgnify:CR=1 FL=1
MIANLSAGPSGSSYQDFRLTSNNTALLLTYELASGMDTSSTGSTGATNSSIYDGCFHEVAVPAGNDLFSWCASQHGVAFNESYVAPSVSPNSAQNAWDWFHVSRELVMNTTVGADPIPRFLSRPPFRKTQQAITSSLAATRKPSTTSPRTVPFCGVSVARTAASLGMARNSLSRTTSLSFPLPPS